MKSVPFTIIIGLLFMPIAANAGKPDPGAAAPAIYTELLDCRKIADAQQRLACFDAKSAALAAATAQHLIVVTDREEVRKTRRAMFGFALPESSLLRADDGEAIKRFESTVVSGRRRGDGAWVVVLAAGGTWEQTDSRELALAPKANQKVVITPGAMGSFFVSIDGQTPLRMRRVQ